MVHEQQTFVSQSGLRGGPDFLRRFLVLTTISPQKAFSKNNGCVACGKLVVAHQWSCGARAQMLLEVCVLKRLANHALRGEAAGAQSVASCASCTVDTQRPPTHTHTWTYGVRFRRQTGGRNPLLPDVSTSGSTGCNSGKTRVLFHFQLCGFHFDAVVFAQIQISRSWLVSTNTLIFAGSLHPQCRNANATNVCLLLGVVSWIWTQKWDGLFVFSA